MYEKITLSFFSMWLFIRRHWRLDWNKNAGGIISYIRSYIIGSKLTTIPHMNSETDPSPSNINVVCKFLGQSLRTKFLLLLFQYAAGRIYFCKVNHSRISKNFRRNRLGLKNFCQVLQLYVPKWYRGVLYLDKY